MNLKDSVKLIEYNSIAIINEMKIIFIKIVDNILKNPDNPTYRTLKKTNALVSKKILGMKGGREMLLFMGFSENGTDYTLGSKSLDLHRLKTIREDLVNWQPVHRSMEPDRIASSSTDILEPEFIIAKEVSLPPLVHKYANPFLRKVTAAFHHALVYGNKHLRENARKRIPVQLLENSAAKKMRDMQQENEKEERIDETISMQDLLMVELLRWFKEEFFTWVDTPDCEKCGESTVFSHMSTDENMMLYTNRVEMHHCSRCNQLTPFPRYNDLNILLETRRGRCGEWANTFTLMCHAMGWDARIVHDETDHVWTEVYSSIQKRWIHCDPCDNVCDVPLMYEHGWKKLLTYVIAYSPDELQDVTWRYSSNHKALLKRRKNCSENELVNAIIELRKERFKSLTPIKQAYMLKRSLAELADLMIERQPKDDEKQGRTSGSLDWRISRGEMSELKWIPYTFEFTDSHLCSKQVVIRYSCALDRYETIGGDAVQIDNWHRGVFDQKEIARKEEHDWKQVYLSRKEGASQASISWKVVLRETQKVISSVELRMENKTFENGEVSIRITGGNAATKTLPSDNKLMTLDFRGSQTLLIEAHMSGGKGQHAWQHAQLFRQSLDSTEYPFELCMTFE